MSSVPLRSQAVVLDGFGDASHLHLREIDTPRLQRTNQMLVRVEATSVNPIEWKMREGLGLPRWVWRRAIGERMVLGIDFAGTVVARGEAVSGFKIGDKVMGATPRAGAYSEYLVVEPDDRATAVVRKPSHVATDLAALVPFAGLVAYAGLVTHGKLARPAFSSRVLIVGASGGVGHLAVQMAKHGLGVGHVVGVASCRNADFIRSLGADEVIPHDQVSVEAIPEHYPDWACSFDLILDAVGLDTYYTIVARHLLKPTGRFVSAALPQMKPGQAGEDVGLWSGLGLFGRLVARMLRGRYAMIAGLIGGLPTKDGLPQIVEWLETGKLRPRPAVVYELAQIREAHKASETGRTVGKIAVRVP